METTTTSSVMTDKELREIEFYANLGVISEDYVFRLLAEIRRLQDEVASVSGIDMIVATSGSHFEAAASDAETRGVADAVLRRMDT
jgi:hypothetical protein